MKLLVAAMITLVLVGCGGGSSPASPVAPDAPSFSFGRDLIMVSGSDQQGSVGEALAEPFQVRVTDREGLPLEGLSVFWQILEGDGRVDAPRVSIDGEPGEAAVTTTSADGIAEAAFVPGAGRNRVRASTFFAERDALFDATGLAQ